MHLCMCVHEQLSLKCNKKTQRVQWKPAFPLKGVKMTNGDGSRTRVKPNLKLRKRETGKGTYTS